MQTLAGFSNFQDPDGVIRKLPARLAKKEQLALALLQYLPEDPEFTEADIKQCLEVFVLDHALIRRMLVDMGYLDRVRDGSVYRRTEKSQNK